MFKLLLPTTVGLAETQGGGEDGPTPLSGLYGARDKAASVAHPFDVVEDRDFGITGENEVAVHAVDGKVGGNGSHGRGEGLRNRGTTVDTAGPGRVPKRSSVGEDILYYEHDSCVSGSRLTLWWPGMDGWVSYRPNIDNGRQFQDVFDRRLGGIQLRRVEQGHIFGHFART